MRRSQRLLQVIGLLQRRKFSLMKKTYGRHGGRRLRTKLQVAVRKNTSLFASSFSSLVEGAHSGDWQNNDAKLWWIICLKLILNILPWNAVSVVYWKVESQIDAPVLCVDTTTRQVYLHYYSLPCPRLSFSKVRLPSPNNLSFLKLPVAMYTLQRDATIKFGWTLNQYWYSLICSIT